MVDWGTEQGAYLPPLPALRPSRRHCEKKHTLKKCMAMEWEAR